MMKRILPLVLCVVLLSGCSSGRIVRTTYPYLAYRNSSYNFDKYNRKLDITDGYVLDEGHSYDIVETDGGYDVVLHFVKLNKDGETNG